jgi:hypothetical protein
MMEEEIMRRVLFVFSAFAMFAVVALSAPKPFVSDYLYTPINPNSIPCINHIAADGGTDQCNTFVQGGVGILNGGGTVESPTYLGFVSKVEDPTQPGRRVVIRGGSVTFRFLVCPDGQEDIDDPTKTLADYVQGNTISFILSGVEQPNEQEPMQLTNFQQFDLPLNSPLVSIKKLESYPYIDSTKQFNNPNESAFCAMYDVTIAPLPPSHQPAAKYYAFLTYLPLRQELNLGVGVRYHAWRTGPLPNGAGFPKPAVGSLYTAEFRDYILTTYQDFPDQFNGNTGVNVISHYLVAEVALGE